MEQERGVEVLERIDVIAVDIRRLFDDYCKEYNIEDMTKAKQTQFKGAMEYIYRRYFKQNNVLKSSPYYAVKNSINNIMTNFNQYDIELLYELYLYIQELANGYDKAASVAIFKALTGISRQCLDNWRNNARSDDGASPSSLAGIKKAFILWLTDSEEDELKEFNMRNPLGPQERLNVDHGRREIRVSMRCDASSLPVRSAEEIAASYGRAALPDGGGMELPDVPE